jgi:hypothetical protein
MTWLSLHESYLRKRMKLLVLLKRADMAIEDAEESARAIRFECWDSSRPPVYFATEKKAFDWVKKQGWILGSKCWSYWPNESEARITVYASEDDKNYGDIFDHVKGTSSAP